MRYIYMIVGLIFIGLGILHFIFNEENVSPSNCIICSGLSKKENALVEVRIPSQPLVEGHYILFTNRHIGAFEDFTQEEKKSLLGLLGLIEKRYLSEFGLVGHSQTWSSSISGHLFIDVIPKKGVRNFLFFQLTRLVRNLGVKGGSLFLDNQSLVLDSTDRLD